MVGIVFCARQTAAARGACAFPRAPHTARQTVYCVVITTTSTVWTKRLRGARHVVLSACRAGPRRGPRQRGRSLFGDDADREPVGVRRRARNRSLGVYRLAVRLAVFQLTAPAGEVVQLPPSAQNTRCRRSAAKAAKALWPASLGKRRLALPRLFLCGRMVKSLLKLSLSVPGACSGWSEGCCCRRRPAPELQTLAAAELLRSDRFSASQISFRLAWIARPNRHRWRPGNAGVIPGGSPASAASHPGAVIPPARLPTKTSNHANF